MFVRGKSMEAKQQQLLVGMEKRPMSDYWSDLSDDLHAGVPTKEENESNLAMLWGSINENSAIVTYLNKFLAENKDDLVLRETGIWLLSDDKNQSWLGSSTDGIIDLNGRRERVLEMKRPFMGGKPIPYKNVCIDHIPQIMLEMFCTSTQECHYVVWTSIDTKVFLVKRDDKYMDTWNC